MTATHCPVQIAPGLGRQGGPTCRHWPRPRVPPGRRQCALPAPPGAPPAAQPAAGPAWPAPAPCRGCAGVIQDWLAPHIRSRCKACRDGAQHDPVLVSVAAKAGIQWVVTEQHWHKWEFTQAMRRAGCRRDMMSWHVMTAAKSWTVPPRSADRHAATQLGAYTSNRPAEVPGRGGNPSCGLTKSGAVKSQHPQASPGSQRLHDVAPGKAAATKAMYEQDGCARVGGRFLQQQERLR